MNLEYLGESGLYWDIRKQWDNVNNFDISVY